MAAMPLGMVIGAFLLGRVAAPSARIRMMGWLGEWGGVGRQEARSVLPSRLTRQGDRVDAARRLIQAQRGEAKPLGA